MPVFRGYAITQWLLNYQNHPERDKKGNQIRMAFWGLIDKKWLKNDFLCQAAGEPSEHKKQVHR